MEYHKKRQSRNNSVANSACAHVHWVQICLEHINQSVDTPSEFTASMELGRWIGVADENQGAPMM